jgi:hypothetical protein
MAFGLIETPSESMTMSIIAGASGSFLADEYLPKSLILYYFTPSPFPRNHNIQKFSLLLTQSMRIHGLQATQSSYRRFAPSRKRLLGGAAFFNLIFL